MNAQASNTIRPTTATPQQRPRHTIHQPPRQDSSSPNMNVRSTAGGHRSEKSWRNLRRPRRFRTQQARSELWETDPGTAANHPTAEMPPKQRCHGRCLHPPMQPGGCAFNTRSATSAHAPVRLYRWFKDYVAPTDDTHKHTRWGRKATVDRASVEVGHLASCSTARS